MLTNRTAAAHTLKVGGTELKQEDKMSSSQKGSKKQESQGVGEEYKLRNQREVQGM